MRREFVVESIKQATLDVFETMLGTSATPGETYQETRVMTPSDGVVSLIGLAGPWMGTGSLACSPSMACVISGKLLMTEFDSVNDEVLDAVAEVTNMIIGNVKTMLEAQLGQMALSIPTVVFGRNFTARSASSEEWVVVPFAVENDRLEVKLCLAQNLHPLHVAQAKLLVQVP